MSALLRIAFRNLLSKRLRTVLTLVAIAVGTAAISATLSTNGAIEASLRQSAFAVTGNADVLVQASNPEGFPTAALRQVQQLPNVRLAVGRVQKRTFVRTATTRGFVELVGIDPKNDPLVHPYQLLAGNGLTGDSSKGVLIGDRFARRFDLKVADSVDLVTQNGFATFEVAGIISEVDPSKASSEGLIYVNLAVAQNGFGVGDRLHQMDIALVNAAGASQLETQLAGSPIGNATIRQASDVREELEGSVADFKLLLYFFGAIASVVGAFLVYNSLSMSVLEQTREIGLLRTIGASMDQIRFMTLGQGCMLAVGGAIPGALLGQALAFVLATVFESLRHVPLATTPLSPQSALIGVGIGTLATLVATAVPAWKSGRLTPLLAASTFAGASSTERDLRQRRPAIALGILLTVFLALSRGQALLWLNSAIALTLCSLLIYLSPLLIDGFLLLSQPLWGRFAGMGILIRRNFQREKGRTASTLAGFLVSFAFVVALSNVAESSNSTGQRWVASLFPGEYAVIAPVPQGRRLVSEFAKVPGVERASPVSLQSVVWNGSSFTAAGVDPISYATAFEFVDGQRESSFAALRRGNAILVPARLARDLGLHRGDSLPLQFGTEKASFTVAAVIAHSFPNVNGYEAIVLSLDDLRRYARNDSFNFIAITASPNAEPNAVLHELTLTAEQYGMETNSVDNLKSSVHRAMQLLLILFGGLVATGIVISSLGLVNTMMMNVSQRRRELGILRVAGMTPDQVQWLTVSEAVILGSFGALMGVIGGTFLTWLLVTFARTPDFDIQFSFSPTIGAVSLGLGLVSAMIAAWYPAHQAASMSVVDAIRLD